MAEKVERFQWFWIAFVLRSTQVNLPNFIKISQSLHPVAWTRIYVDRHQTGKTIVETIFKEIRLVRNFKWMHGQILQTFQFNFTIKKLFETNTFFLYIVLGSRYNFKEQWSSCYSKIRPPCSFCFVYVFLYFTKIQHPIVGSSYNRIHLFT